MNDQFQEQTSLFVDDELTAEECEFFVRRLQRDPDARGRLGRYHLIGAALRGELKTTDPEVLRRRLQAAMDGVSRSQSARAPQRVGYARFIKPALGLAMAASVTVAALLMSRTSGTNGASEAPISATASLGASAEAEVQSASNVVPPVLDPRLMALPPVRLTNYMMQHGEYASRFSRTSVHSNVVTIGQPDMLSDNGSPEQ
jgi:sigma-E factor negative regulatory protein RseA